MNIPKDLLYTIDHEWLRFTGDTSAQIGITDSAQSALGNFVYANLPVKGDSVNAGLAFAEIKSEKLYPRYSVPLADGLQQSMRPC